MWKNETVSVTFRPLAEEKKNRTHSFVTYGISLAEGFNILRYSLERHSRAHDSDKRVYMITFGCLDQVVMLLQYGDKQSGS